MWSRTLCAGSSQPWAAIVQIRWPSPAKLPSQAREGGLGVPGQPVIIDGMSENSPFALDPLPAVFANHSSRPNAQLEVRKNNRGVLGNLLEELPRKCETEKWPVSRAGGPPRKRKRNKLPCHCATDQLFLVAIEQISVGQEIRFDYEDGADTPGMYWLGEQPIENDWRSKRVSVLPVLRDEPIPEAAPMPWEGRLGGDARLPALIRACGLHSWRLISSHLRGRTAKECKERWALVKSKAARAHTANEVRSPVANADAHADNSVKGSVSGATLGVCKGSAADVFTPCAPRTTAGAPEATADATSANKSCGILDSSSGQISMSRRLRVMVECRRSARGTVHAQSAMITMRQEGGGFNARFTSVQVEQ
eukprot:CAMPEP_0119340906 /NCGR_PEP_ID=MMETSP1333-20130426/101247_1 /TAXON_ID=418940 /ORGANISM="Scyphosphaera apsteinii, Strain RCC1455" /LENGTH=364 /DNA_ID=CAMNT_0007352767 /DNA_START=95 /DNA_END=1191 /DNA_ORIENTATION=-